MLSSFCNAKGHFMNEVAVVFILVIDLMRGNPGDAREATSPGVHARLEGTGTSQLFCVECRAVKASNNSELTVGDRRLCSRRSHAPIFDSLSHPVG